MDNNEFQQAVLAQLQMLNTRLDNVDARLDRMESDIATIKTDVKRLDSKIDTLSADVGQAMMNLTDNVDKEIIKLKIIK